MHQMTCIETHPSGAETWLCPECSRRIILQWSPFKRIALFAGDERALHSGGVGLEMTDVQVSDARSSRLEGLLSDVKMDGD